MFGCLVVCLVGWLVVCLVVCLVVWLVGWLVGWLVVWLVGCLLGWLLLHSFVPEPHFLFGSSQVYDRSCYEGQLQSLDASLRHVGGVFVEALSVCHTDLSGPSYSQQCWYLRPIKLSDLDLGPL